MTTWELKVANTAVQLNELALEISDIETAVSAAERALRALPTHAGLVEALMKAYAASDNTDAAGRVDERHVTALGSLGIDDLAESTMDLRDEIMRASQDRPSA
jgi:hypothetical protein